MAVVTIDAKGEIAEYVAAQEPVAEAKQTPSTETAKEGADKAPATAEQVTEADPDDIEGDDGLTPRQKRELTQNAVKRIAKKHREMKEAEEFAAAQYSEKRLAEARALAAEAEVERLKAAQPKPAETKPDPEAGKPKRADFQTDEAYWEAVIDWRADQRADKKVKELEAARATERAEQERAEIVAAASARVAKAVELVPDFQRLVIDRAEEVMIPKAITGYLDRSPLMPEVVYHLVTHPEVLESLFKLRPDEQLVTIGKIEGTLKPFEPQGSKVTNGAKPDTTAANGNASHEAEPGQTGTTPGKGRGTAPVITPLTSASGVQVEKDRADMDIREVIQNYTKTHRVNLGLRKRH